MSNRAGKLTGERRSLVAVAVYFARRNEIPWKRLERIYGRTERQLRRLEGLAARLMSDNSRLMSGLGACAHAAGDRMFDALPSTLVAGDSMDGLFGGGPRAPDPVAPPPAPTLSDPAVTNAARQEQIAAARTRGRAATILTGGMGTTTPAPTAQKVLLGS